MLKRPPDGPSCSIRNVSPYEIEVMRYSADTLDYSALTREADALAAPAGANTVKVAILADCAVQQLTTLLKVLAARNGVALDVAAPSYNELDHLKGLAP